MHSEFLEKDKYYNEEDIRANEFTLKCIRTIIPVITGALVIYVIFSLITSFSNNITIALPNTILTIKGLVSSLVTLVLTHFIGKRIPPSDTRLKYFFLYASLLMVILVQVYMSYIMTLVTFAPILIAAQYSDKKLFKISYVLLLLSNIAIIILSYEIGLCDANMVLFPTNTLESYKGTLSGDIKPLSEVISSLFALFILPRFILITAFAPLINAIIDNKKEIIVNEYHSRYQGEHDAFTGFYNRNKYNSLVETFLKHDTISILFFDINNLKFTNDTRGHNIGDKLILMAAESIARAASENMYYFRFGGDEFLVVIPNGNLKDAENMIQKWKPILQKINDESPNLKCEIAYGYTSDKGEQLHSCLRTADMNMYENKMKHKMNRSVSNTDSAPISLPNSI